MSAYGHQMEHVHSTRSLSASSEMRSSFVLESGFYITSFSATIFIAGFAALGLLLITLLVSMAMMLQSCQSNRAGIVELRNIYDDYSYCKIHSLHAKLNHLEEQNVPEICKDLAVQYIKGGQYARDLDLTKSVIEEYFNGVKPSDDGFDVVLIDIDGIFPSNSHSSNLLQSIGNCIIEAKNLKRMAVLRIYTNLQASGWPIILLSRESVEDQNVTINHLVSAGFTDWSSLMMREGEDSTKMNEYFSRQRNMIQTRSFRIKSIISNHVNVLSIADADKEMRKFLLPDSVCDMFEHQMKA